MIPIATTVDAPALLTVTHPITFPNLNCQRAVMQSGLSAVKVKKYSGQILYPTSLMSLNPYQSRAFQAHLAKV